MSQNILEEKIKMNNEDLNYLLGKIRNLEVDINRLLDYKEIFEMTYDDLYNVAKLLAEKVTNAEICDGCSKCQTGECKYTKKCTINELIKKNRELLAENKKLKETL